MEYHLLAEPKVAQLRPALGPAPAFKVKCRIPPANLPARHTLHVRSIAHHSPLPHTFWHCLWHLRGRLRGCATCAVPESWPKAPAGGGKLCRCCLEMKDSELGAASHIADPILSLPLFAALESAQPPSSPATSQALGSLRGLPSLFTGVTALQFGAPRYLT